MDNNLIFKALSSPTRVKILQNLTIQEMHLSGLAREIGISVPVTSKHIKILENAGLINKKVYGNVYLLSIKINNLERLLEPFVEVRNILVDSEHSIFDALSQIPGITVEKEGKNHYISSIDGEEGYYIYEVDGKLPKKPINEYKINKKITLDLKKIISIKKKKINIDIKKENK